MRAKDIQRPTEHRKPQENRCQDYHTPPGVETGRPPQLLNLGWASLGWCQNLSDPGPDADQPAPTPVPNYHHPLERGPRTTEGSTRSKPAQQPQPTQDETLPTPQ
ncbi:hypothetical protein ATANTOWER_027588 [Ataeniobius toweri]|uniref:Uncharacterized protein n=1 Tax=Ataeniobius toweri TaxID=208326 RepID=A0ABU7B291_9TELE|nr:hypothetical protein [Ataeniobius toweri]